MSIGEDMSSTVFGVAGSVSKEVARETLRFIFEIMKYKMTHEKNIEVKIPYGQVKMSKLDELRQNGEKVEYTTFPNEYVNRMSELAQKYGISFAVVDVSPGKIATVAYPQKSRNEVLAALKQIAAEQEDKYKGSLKFKDNFISEKDYDVASRVLECHDIPTFQFKSKDGTLAVVPKDYEQQFDGAMKEAKALSKQLGNIETITFEQTYKLNEIDYRIETLPMTEAVELQRTLNSLENAPEIEFIKSDENHVDIKYGVDNADMVADLKKAYIDDRSIADAYLTDYIGNEISINKDALLVKETEEQYFAKVPNTNGQSFVYLNKAEFSEKGGSISGKIDLKADYSIFDKDGAIKGTVSGSELAEHYNGKSKFINKETKVTYTNANGLEHIELYNNKTNELIQLNMDSAENMRKILCSLGFNNRTADILLSNIKDAISEEKRDVFNYKTDFTEIKYADIADAENLKTQQHIAQMLADAEDVSGAAANVLGEKVCVYDKNTNKYALIPLSNRTDITAAISNKMGYDYIKSMITADKIIGSLDDRVLNGISKELETKHFETNNIVLHNLSFAKEENDTFLISDKGNTIDFISFDNKMSRHDVEQAIVTKLKIEDKAAVAELMDKLDEANALSPCTQFKAYDKSITVNMVSSAYCSITDKADRKIYLPIEDISAEKISKSFGVDLSSAEQISSSILKTLENVKNPASIAVGTKLNDMIRVAADKFKKLSSERTPAQEKQEQIGR